MRVVYDIETDGLYRDATEMYCGVCLDIDTDEVTTFKSNQTGEMVSFLNKCSLAISHNGISFDIPVLEKLSGIPCYLTNQFDTLVASRLIFSNLMILDQRGYFGYRPDPIYRGTHSLRSWGIRLNIMKADYPDEHEINGDSEELLKYCIQDCRVTKALYEQILSRMESYQWNHSFKIEMEIAAIMAEQERNGFHFNTQKALELAGDLTLSREKTKDILIESMKGRYVKKGEKEVFKVFNPASRQDIAAIFKEKYNWEPKEFTPTGNPIITEAVLDKLDFPEAGYLVDYLQINKILGMLVNGKNAWLKLVTKDNFIHGHVNPNGAITGRATHSKPNLAQIPSCNVPWGEDCRDLFDVPEGWSLIGSDADGLELRCLAHYMSPYDKGVYKDILLNDDIHTANQKAAGLPDRASAKTFIYAFLYGAGDEKLGSIIEPNASKGRQSSEGRKLRKSFLSKLPALDKLIKDVKSNSNRGYLKGLDGRKLFIRSEHSALNTLLQAAGAIICKKWLINIHDLFEAYNLKCDWYEDFVFCAWIHDEVQIAVRKDTESTFIDLITEAMNTTESDLNFNCPLACTSRWDETWRYTH